jgi:protein-S-isoprenylcysteine O-methyltransferase Ste14
MAGLVALLMQIGRGIVAVIMGNALDIAAGFILGDALSGVFAMVIVGIARKLDGVFEDQKHYLLRINREEKELEEGFDEG